MGLTRHSYEALRSKNQEREWELSQHKSQELANDLDERARRLALHRAQQAKEKEIPKKRQEPQAPKEEDRSQIIAERRKERERALRKKIQESGDVQSYGKHLQSKLMLLETENQICEKKIRLLKAKKKDIELASKNAKVLEAERARSIENENKKRKLSIQSKKSAQEFLAMRENEKIKRIELEKKMKAEERKKALEEEEKLRIEQKEKQKQKYELQRITKREIDSFVKAKAKQRLVEEEHEQEEDFHVRKWQEIKETRRQNELDLQKQKQDGMFKRSELLFDTQLQEMQRAERKALEYEEMKRELYLYESTIAATKDKNTKLYEARELLKENAVNVLRKQMREEQLKHEDYEYSKRLREELAERDRIDQMTAVRKRSTLIRHRDEIRKMIDEKKRERKMAREKEINEANRLLELNQEEIHLIEDEKNRLLNEYHQQRELLEQRAAELDLAYREELS